MMVQISWINIHNNSMAEWCKARELMPAMVNRCGLYYLCFDNNQDATAFKLRFGL